MSTRVTARRSIGATVAVLVTGLLAALLLSWNVAASAAPYPPSTPPPSTPVTTPPPSTPPSTPPSSTPPGIAPDSGSRCTVSTTTVNAGPGDSVNFVGSGFAPNQSVSLSVPALSAALGSVTTNSNGSFSGTFTWPASVNGKSAVVQASAPSTTCSFTLVNSQNGVDANTGSRSNGGGSGGLSSTGFQTLTATTIAVLLIGSGALFLGLSRRRKKV